MQQFFQWKSHNYYIFCVRDCGLIYPSWNAHAPYFRLRPVRLYSITPHYLTNGAIFEKNKLLHTKRVLIFSTNSYEPRRIVWPRIVTDSLLIKPTDALNSNFIGITTLHVSGSLSVHHQEFLSLHRHWYILCSCDESFATRSRMERSGRVVGVNSQPAHDMATNTVTVTRGCIDTIRLFWWWARCARNM
jgi:hypothetical protein